MGLVKTTNVVTKGSRIEFYGFRDVPNVHNRVSIRWFYDIRRHFFDSPTHHQSLQGLLQIHKISLYGELNTWTITCLCSFRDCHVSIRPFIVGPTIYKRAFKSLNFGGGDVAISFCQLKLKEAIYHRRCVIIDVLYLLQSFHADRNL